MLVIFRYLVKQIWKIVSVTLSRMLQNIENIQLANYRR